MINKIDRENADPERVRNELSQYEVIPEDWGGEHLFVNVSAHTGEGIDRLVRVVTEELDARSARMRLTFGPAAGRTSSAGRS